MISNKVSKYKRGINVHIPVRYLTNPQSLPMFPNTKRKIYEYRYDIGFLEMNYFLKICASK